MPDVSAQALGDLAEALLAAVLKRLLTDHIGRFVLFIKVVRAMHDFCDVNMFLHEVFMKYGMDVADDGGMERNGHLWNQAWNLAKSRGFRIAD